MSSFISRDDCVIFKVSSSEMTAWFSRYHLQRWRLTFQGIISRLSRWSEMTTFIMSCHLQRWRLGKQGIISAKVVVFYPPWVRADDVYLRVVISRDEGLLFTVSSPVMTEQFSRYHLQRWWLTFHGIISRIVGQTWLRILWGIILRDEGLENMVSSPLLLNSSWVRDDGVQYQV